MILADKPNEVRELAVGAGVEIALDRTTTVVRTEGWERATSAPHKAKIPYTKRCMFHETSDKFLSPF